MFWNAEWHAWLPYRIVSISNIAIEWHFLYHHISFSLSLSIYIYLHFSFRFCHGKIVAGILIDNKRDVYFRSINFDRMLQNSQHCDLQNIPSTTENRRKKSSNPKMATRNCMKLILQQFTGFSIQFCLMTKKPSKKLNSFSTICKCMNTLSKPNQIRVVF